MAKGALWPDWAMGAKGAIGSEGAMKAVGAEALRGLRELRGVRGCEGGVGCYTYGSISPGQGKWSKCGIFLELCSDQTV